VGTYRLTYPSDTEQISCCLCEYINVIKVPKGKEILDKFGRSSFHRISFFVTYVKDNGDKSVIWLHDSEITSYGLTKIRPVHTSLSLGSHLMWDLISNENHHRVVQK
jgi:hypothetical protein